MQNWDPTPDPQTCGTRTRTCRSPADLRAHSSLRKGPSALTPKIGSASPLQQNAWGAQVKMQISGFYTSLPRYSAGQPR